MFFQEKSKQTKALHPIMAVFKKLWGNNGDMLSLQYSGHISDLKDEKGEILMERSDSIDRFTSVCKIFSENIFQENYRNRCMDILLQKDLRGSNLFIYNIKFVNFLFIHIYFLSS